LRKTHEEPDHRLLILAFDLIDEAAHGERVEDLPHGLWIAGHPASDVAFRCVSRSIPPAMAPSVAGKSKFLTVNNKT
jgi:hypothetical protein